MTRIACSSISLEPNRSKLLTSTFKHFRRWRCHLIQRVIEAELVPLVAPHLMEREHLNSFHGVELSGELGDLRDVLWVISQAWHQHKSNPNLSAQTRKPARKLQSWLHLFSSQLKMARRGSFQAQQDQIDLLDLCVGQTIAQEPIGFDSGVHS